MCFSILADPLKYSLCFKFSEPYLGELLEGRYWRQTDLNGNVITGAGRTYCTEMVIIKHEKATATVENKQGFF